MPRGAFAAKIAGNKADDTLAVTGHRCYVDQVSLSNACSPVEERMDEPFSSDELKQLSSVVLKLGSENSLWQDVGPLLSSLSGQDRSNFLSVLGQASGEVLKDVVRQVGMLAPETRSMYLKLSARLGLDEGLGNLNTGDQTMETQGLENLAKVTDQISVESLSSLLEMADNLNRSRQSIRQGELGNFLKAAASSRFLWIGLLKK